MKRAEKGFSLLELAMVVVIALIITAIALPAVRRTFSSYQLDASGRAIASMLQQVRMAAVKNNTPYYAQYDGAPGVGMAFAVPAIRYPATYDSSSDPAAAVASYVTFLPAAGAAPPHAQLETAMGMAAGAPNLQIGGVIAFNARGLPCAFNGNPWVCTGPVGFEWFMQNSLSQEWEAITVSPAGRIKVWRRSGNGVWQ